MDSTLLGTTLLMSTMLFGSACAPVETRDARAPNAAAAETTAARASSNRALVKALIDEAWVKKDLDSVPKYVANDLVNHAAIPEAQGAAGLQTIWRKVQTAFPDLVVTVQSITAEDDLVVARVTMEGTHTARLDFKRPLEATNKHMKIDQVETYRIKDGRVVEAWLVLDRLDLLTQLGVMRPPGT